MGIWMRNSEGDPNDTIEYRILGEYLAGGKVVNSVSGFAAAPPRTHASFLKVWLGANADGSVPRVELRPWTAPPTRQINRLIGCWGTEHDGADLIRQTQVDRRVTYRGDYTFNFAEQENFTTNGVWRLRHNNGGWPPDFVAAIYFRLEAKRFSGGDSRGTGTGSIVVASKCVDGATNLPANLAFTAQLFGLTRLDQPEVSRDEVRLIAEPGTPTYGVKIDANCKGYVLFSGYELMPTTGDPLRPPTRMPLTPVVGKAMNE
jgi:hypothetical protein